MALIADHAKPLELLKEAVPEVSRIVFIYDPEVRPGGYGEASLATLQKEARKARHNSSAVASARARSGRYSVQYAPCRHKWAPIGELQH